MKRSLIIVSFLVQVAAVACSRGLSHSEAVRTIRAHRSMKPSDTVAIEGISSSSSSESIVRANIDGSTLNLKFRRFDTGWTWEFAETKGGGWIAADEAAVQIHEPGRLEEAKQWADRQRNEYAVTAGRMYQLLTSGPTPKVGLNAAQWMKWRTTFAEILEKYHSQPGWQDQASLLRNPRAADAWGSEFLVNFDEAENRMVLLSVGPDKTKQTPDDLIAVWQFRPVMENGEIAWSSDENWTLPEFLDTVVQGLRKAPFHRIESSRVVR